jgi:dCTP deaminase
MITRYRGLLADWQIAILATDHGMIQPFTADKIREIDGHSAISYGLSSHGYDLRLSDKEFFVFRHVPGNVIDPKRHKPESMEKAVLQEGKSGRYFILPGNSYGLGTTPDRLKMPLNVQGQATGKSTYARSGIIVNITPVEAGWEGHLTLEFSNSSNADCRIYADEGVCQIVFLAGEPPKLCYVQRGAKYQDQPERVVFGKV